MLAGMDEARLGARTRGVWTRRVALQALTPGEIDARLRAGTWQVVWPGTYADAGHVLDAEQRAVAAVLASRARRAGRPAVACLRTAARLHGLPLVDDDDPSTGRREHRIEHVAVDRHVPALRLTGRVLHRHQLVLAPHEVLRLPCGVLATTVARTLRDCARVLRPEALVCAADVALRRHLVALDELAGQLRPRADAGAESPAETLARLLLQPVLPSLVPQVEVRDARGRIVARVDLGDPKARFAVECDGKRGHAGDVMVAKDRRRDALTAALGWHVERVTWHELRTAGPAVVRRVLAAHARHTAARRAG